MIARAALNVRVCAGDAVRYVMCECALTKLYLADYNCSSRVVDESRDIVFRHGHTRVVPLFVTTHEHFGIEIIWNLFRITNFRYSDSFRIINLYTLFCAAQALVAGSRPV